MADRRSTAVLARRRELVTSEDRRSLTAAVLPLTAYDSMALTIAPTEPQREAWTYYHSLGEVNYGIGSWLANSVSRCRLFLGQRVIGSDDPIEVKTGPLAKAVSQLGGGADGQRKMLRRMAVQVSVPGESFLVTEDDPESGQRTYKAYSNTEIRITGRSPLRYQINAQRNIWRPLADESMVSRVWWPDDEIEWMASSPVMAALPIMREVDMYNRYIISILLSRVANNGILLVPSQVTFPSKPQYKDAADPFMAELIDASSRAIKSPGTAAAALPLPVKVSAEMIEKFRHLTFATEIGDKIIVDRNSALSRLATALNLPAEVLTGMGQVNHWGQWQLEESGVKLHVCPVVDVIVGGFTESWLKPVAASLGINTMLPDGSEYVVWYDHSALVEQPDRSDVAQALHDRGTINDDALRRDSGADTDDAPTMLQLKNQILTKIALGGGADSLAALSILVGDPTIAQVPQRIAVTDQTTGAPDQPGSNPPATAPTPPQDGLRSPTEPVRQPEPMPTPQPTPTRAPLPAR